MITIAGHKDTNHILRRDLRIVACPLCQQALTPSQFGLKGHFKGKHKDLPFEERRVIEDQIFEGNKKQK